MNPSLSVLGAEWLKGKVTELSTAKYCNSKVNRSNKTGTWLDEY